MTTAPTDSAITETADAVGIRSSALFGLRPYHEEAAVTIYHGDCRQIVPLLGRFDLLLTDPPYGIFKKTGGDGKMFGKRTIYSDDDTAAQWDALVLAFRPEWRAGVADVNPPRYLSA